MASGRVWPGRLTRLHAACLFSGIRCGACVLTKGLVTGDVMRSDYRLAPNLAAKGWPVIPQPLKECFVKSGWDGRGEKGDRVNDREGENKRCAGELNNT